MPLVTSTPRPRAGTIVLSIVLALFGLIVFAVIVFGFLISIGK